MIHDGTLLQVDGSFGEGGGQILRSALGLSLATRRPFRIRRIRAGRSRPGLLAQHLTAVRAAAQIGGAQVEGASPGSEELTFVPGEPRPSRHRFAVGTAGSATLVFQAVLPALLCGTYEVVFEGGTHNPQAPPWPFLQRTFLPALRAMGARLEAHLDRPGFFPAGGGAFVVRSQPWRPTRCEWLQRGAIRAVRATALVAALPDHIAERELRIAERELGASGTIERHARGPGNVLWIEIDTDPFPEVVAAFGARGRRAEDVAREAVQAARRYLEAQVPVGEHLADQLLVPMALAGGGAFRTPPPSNHTRTNAEVVARFLPVEVRLEGELVRVVPRASAGS